MSDNPLVAAPVAPQPSAFGGAYLLQDAADLSHALQSGDWVEGGMAAFSTVLDTVGAVIDPIGTLLANGLGWVLDHIEPLRGWLQDLSGNASEVMAFSQTWSNAAGKLQQVGGDIAHRLGDIEGMSGEAVDAYRAHGRRMADSVASMGSWADAVSSGLEIASTLVQAVYELVRDAIAQVVGTAISAAITTAATVGFGAPVAVGQIVTKVASLAGKVGRFVEHLLTSLRRAVPLIDKLAGAASKVASHIGEWLKGFRPSGYAPSATGVQAVPPRAKVGHTNSTDYRDTFFTANPSVSPPDTVVHHAVEQQIMNRYPGVATPEQLHSIENLRGIPKSLNNTLHLSEIRIAWNKFYRTHKTATLDELLDYATKLDDEFGHLFDPPIR